LVFGGSFAHTRDRSDMPKTYLTLLTHYLPCHLFTSWRATDGVTDRKYIVKWDFLAAHCIYLVAAKVDHFV
jgi:hypothetical protein